ncbi:MAG TPA: EamA family transporter RarD [Allosphingosinicella sp.]|jgi:chloramphenicol-sensitive protein RarD|uniref:EamA family transporter RarD n=1 Tax=Allosphingosinicella sp. TaxID=2823234 RepID=UPI002F28EE6B
MSEDQHRRTRAGLLFGLGAYLMWGFLPLYFKLLASVRPTEIVAHRIVWSVLFLAALVVLWKRWPAVRAAVSSRMLGILTVTAALIGANWLIWVWAVMNGHVLEGSLGYYLNPLVNVLLGVALLGERLSPARTFAVALAAAGVAVLAFGAGEGLWISLSLAVSFALYGYIRKVSPVDALEGLTIETAILTPIALGWILWLNRSGSGGLGMDGLTIALLVLAGAVTAVPLLLFTAAAKRLPYSTLGFLQYIAPSIQFLLAVLLFGERLSTAHIICFGAIWIALVIFAAEGWRLGRVAARERAATL